MTVTTTPLSADRAGQRGPTPRRAEAPTQRDPRQVQRPLPLGCLHVVFGIAKPHVFLTPQHVPADLRRGGGHRHPGPGLPRPPDGRRLRPVDRRHDGPVACDRELVRRQRQVGADRPGRDRLAVVLCCAVGLVSGIIVVKFRVNSLIATLGMSQVLIAVELKISNNRQITGAFSNRFESLGSRNVLGIPIVHGLSSRAGHHHLVRAGAHAGRPISLRGGRQSRGGPPGRAPSRAAHLRRTHGVGRHRRHSRRDLRHEGGHLRASSTGPGLLFPALAAVFFGASQFSRRPNVWGTLVAYFALAFGVKGLQIAFGPGTFWIEPLFQGATLLIAVALASRVVGQTRRSRQSTEGGGPRRRRRRARGGGLDRRADPVTRGPDPTPTHPLWRSYCVDA